MNHSLIGGVLRVGRGVTQTCLASAGTSVILRGHSFYSLYLDLVAADAI